MKLLLCAASLATLAQARRAIMSPNPQRTALKSQMMANLEQKLGEHFIQLPDGFEIDLKPYFNMEVVNDGNSGDIVWCLPTSQSDFNLHQCDPNNQMHSSWSIIDQPGAVVLDLETKGNIQNSLGQLMPNVNPVNIVDDFQSKVHVMCSWDLSGVKLSKKLTAGWNWVDGSPRAQLEAEHHLQGTFRLAQNKLILNIDSAADVDVNNVRRPGKAMSNPLLRPISVRSGLDLTVQNIQRCGHWVSNPQNAILNNEKCEIELKSKVHSGRTPLSRQPVADVAVMMAMRPYVIMCKSHININSQTPNTNRPYMIFFRAEDKDGKMEKLNAGNYYSLYATRQNNWQKALKQDNAELVIRAPGHKTAENIILPQIQNRWQPWSKLLETLSTQDVRTHLYLYYNIDKFLKNFSDEFDCSEVVRMSRIESESMRTPLERLNRITGESFPVGLNDFLRHQCQTANDEIIDAIQHPAITQVMNDVRSIVRDVSSQEGERKYQRLFNNIF